MPIDIKKNRLAIRWLASKTKFNKISQHYNTIYPTKESLLYNPKNLSIHTNYTGSCDLMLLYVLYSNAMTWEIYKLVLESLGTEAGMRKVNVQVT